MTVFTFKSKTHAVSAVLGIFGGLSAFLPTVRDLISPEIYSWSFVGISVVYIILRNVTTEAISDK